MTSVLGRRSLLLPALLMVPLMGGALCFPPLLYAAHADPDDPDEEDKARTDADAAIKNAVLPLDKINAYFHRAKLPDKMADPDDSDWALANSDIDEAIKLAEELEKDGTFKLNNKAELYFWQGYAKGNYSDHDIDYAGMVTSFDRAEALGYEALHTKDDDKGAELWNNRGNAKRHVGDYDGALRDFDSAVARSNDWLWLRNRANFKFASGDYDGAVADWTLAWGKKAAIGPSTFDPELAALNKAVVASPKLAAPLVARSRYYLKQALKAKDRENIDTGALPFFVAYQMDEPPAKPKTRTYSKLEAMKLVLDDLDLAVKVEPASSSAYLERGRARNLFSTLPEWKSERKYPEDGAVTNFQKAVELDDKNAGAWYELGSIQLQKLKDADLPLMNETDAAFQARKLAFIQAGITDFSRAIFLKPDSSGQAHFLRAFLERNRPKLDENAVIVDYKTAIAQKLSQSDDNPYAGSADPNALADANSALGRVISGRGHLSEGLAYLNQAVQLNSGDLDSRNERAKILLQQGKYDEAITDLDFIIKANAKVGQIWIYRAAAYDAKKDSEKAKADIAQALQLDATLVSNLNGTRYDPKTPQPNVGLLQPPVTGDLPAGLTGTALEHKDAGNALRGKGDDAGALEEYDNAIRLDPKFTDGYNNRGTLYGVRHEDDLALADFDKAIEIDPKHRVAYLSRATLWGRNGDLARQGTDLELAIKYAENDDRKAQAFRARSEYRLLKNDSAGALADARKTTELAPKSIGAWQQLGKTQLTANQYPDAVVSYKKAVELDPKERTSHFFLTMALGYTDDPGALAELKLALVDAPLGQLKAMADSFDLGMQRKPDSKVFPQLKAALPKPAVP